MKQTLFYNLLLLLPLCFMAAACDDDNANLPNVSISATISGGVLDNEEIYVVQGTDLVIDGLTLVNNSGKEGTLGAVTYYWDHYLVGTNIVQPYGLTINTADQKLGRHLLQAQMPIYVVDHPICYGFIQYYVNIVATEAELPGGGTDTPDTPDNPGGETGGTVSPAASFIVNGIIKAKE